MEEGGVDLELCFVISCYEFTFLVFFGEFFVVCGASSFAIPVSPVFAICFQSANGELKGPCIGFFEFQCCVFDSSVHYFGIQASPCNEEYSGCFFVNVFCELDLAKYDEGEVCASIRVTFSCHPERLHGVEYRHPKVSLYESTFC